MNIVDSLRKMHQLSPLEWRRSRNAMFLISPERFTEYVDIVQDGMSDEEKNAMKPFASKFFFRGIEVVAL